MGLTPKKLAVRSPEFEWRNSDMMGLEVEVMVGQPADKFNALSTITFRTNQIGGYDMRAMVQGKHSDAWCQPVEVGAICIQIVGEYERQVLIAALHRIGLLTKLVYGTIEHGPFENPEE